MPSSTFKPDWAAMQCQRLSPEAIQIIQNLIEDPASPNQALCDAMQRLPMPPEKTAKPSLKLSGRLVELVAYAVQIEDELFEERLAHIRDIQRCSERQAQNERFRQAWELAEEERCTGKRLQGGDGDPTSWPQRTIVCLRRALEEPVEGDNG